VGQTRAKGPGGSNLPICNGGPRQKGKLKGLMLVLKKKRGCVSQKSAKKSTCNEEKRGGVVQKSFQKGEKTIGVLGGKETSRGGSKNDPG